MFEFPGFSTFPFLFVDLLFAISWKCINLYGLRELDLSVILGLWFPMIPVHTQMCLKSFILSYGIIICMNSWNWICFLVYGLLFS